MTRRRALHAGALNLLLVAGATFYFFAPTVYAYFSEVRMTYSRVPASFARTMPARVTARIFAQYNVHSPVAARLRSRAQCYLVDDGATRKADCAHEVGAGQSVH